MHVYYQTAHVYTNDVVKFAYVHIKNRFIYSNARRRFVHVFHTLFQHSLCMDSDKLDLYAASELHVQLVTTTSKKTSKNAS